MHRAQVIGAIAQKTGIVLFTEPVCQVMGTEPYASAKRVFWIVDNGSSHNEARSVACMAAAWPTAALVYLPVHPSWLNHVEIDYSILQRKAISCADFPDLDPWPTGSPSIWMDLGRSVAPWPRTAPRD